MKFKVVIADGLRLPVTSETLPRIGEEIVMTIMNERARMTVYNVIYDMDRKGEPEVYVR